MTQEPQVDTTVDRATSVQAYPFGPPVALEVDARYARLRRGAPVSRVRLPYRGEAWLITGHSEFRQMMADSRFSTAELTRDDIPRITPEPQPADMILFKDAPEHTRLRRLVAKAFTPRRVEQLRPRIQRIVDELLDDIASHGSPADLVEHFAWPLPVMVICELVGIPYQQRQRFRHFADVVLSTTAYTEEEVIDARIRLRDFLAELVGQRREEPADDLLSALVQAKDNEDRLSEQELVLLGVVLLIGGHEKAASQMANFTYALLGDPARFAELRDDPDLVPAAVEELLRFTPLETNGVFARVAQEDVTIGDVLVRAGEVVVGVGLSANRDERVFTEPDHLDLRREPNPHVAFGHGAHHCLGAQLARAELQIGLGALIRRFPMLQLAVPQTEVPWKAGLLTRGPRALPVTW